MPGDRATHCCIIGAGAAGVTAAATLRHLGYRRVTVLDGQSDHIGGKCQTIALAGLPLDTGAIYVLPNYPTVTRLAQVAGVRLRPAARFVHRAADGRTRPFGQPAHPPSLAGKLAEYGRLGRQLVQYQQVLRRPLGEVNPTLLRGLALPVSHWMQRHHLDYFHQAAYPLLRSFGFGFEEQAIPAAYIFKALPLFARHGNLLSLWNVSAINLRLVREGYGTLWQRLAADLDVRLGVQVLRVARDEAGGQVDTTDGPIPFDHLILACPLNKALAFLDASAEEQELFAKIRSFPVWQAVVEAEGLPPALILDRYQAFSTRGRPMILVRYWPHAPWYYLFGYGRDGLSAEAIRQGIADTMAELGAQRWRLVRYTDWAGYFPHYGSREVAAGYHGRLEQLQGQRATYYAGEIMSNIGVESVATYATRLIQHGFA